MPRDLTYSAAGLAAIVGLDAYAAPLKKGCCDGCGDSAAPCSDAARDALVAGIRDDIKTAQWFIDNRWTIVGVAFAAGGLFFGTVSYFVNRNP